jgi:hypothetical protein
VHVKSLVEELRRRRLPPLQRKVLDYLEAHDDEVFSYRDEQLVRGTKAKASAIGFTLWALHKQDLIGKQEAGGKVYFGDKRAIGRLREEIGVADEDPFVRADRNRQRARERHGDMDLTALLDEVRSGR